MTTLDALRTAIRDNPDDDLARMALGDWLLDQPEESQQARGELIQVQCQMTRLPPADPSRVHLESREQELLRQHRATWLGPLDGEGICAFERGLVRLTLRASNLRSLDRLANSIPWQLVHCLRIEGVASTHVATLVASPGLANVAELELVNRSSLLTREDFQRLAESSHLARLACLRLHDLNLDDHGVRALARSPHLGRLLILELTRNAIRDAGVKALADSSFLGRLKRLNLADNQVRAGGAEAIANTPMWSNLEHLDLGRNILGAGGARMLATGRHLEGLRHLDLRLNGIMAEGARAILDSPLGARLERLNLVGNGILVQPAKGRLTGFVAW